jgi:hypothetical protein
MPTTNDGGEADTRPRGARSASASACAIPRFSATTNMTATRIAAEGLRRWLQEYADACGNGDCQDFLAEVSKAVDTASGSLPM